MRIWQLNGTSLIFFRTFISLWLKRNWINNEKRCVCVFVYWAILIVISHFIDIRYYHYLDFSRNLIKWVFSFVLLILLLLVSHSVMSVDSATSWTVACQAFLSFTVSLSLLKLMSLSRWYHPTTLFTVAHFFSCPQPFPASGSFPMSRLFTSGSQSIGVSASVSVLPMNTQDWFPLGWTGWISLQSKGLSRIFSNTTVQKHQFFGIQPSLWSNSHLYMTTGKTISLTRQASIDKVISLLFNMLSRFVIAFLARSKRLLISWLQSPFAVILEPKKIKSLTVYTFTPSICSGTRCHDVSFLNVEL